MEKALRRATKFTEPEVLHIMQPVQDSFKALREGTATHWQWKQMASAVAIALSIEHQGIVKGLQGHLITADSTLAVIKQRAMRLGTWRPTALWFDELDALDTFAHVHEYQVRALSSGEFSKALAHAIAEIQRVGGDLMDDAREAAQMARATCEA
jgi:hypothetical protein